MLDRRQFEPEFSGGVDRLLVLKPQESAVVKDVLEERYAQIAVELGDCKWLDRQLEGLGRAVAP